MPAEILEKLPVPEPLGALQLDAHARQIAVEIEIVPQTRDRSAAFRRAFEADVSTIQLAYDLSVGWENRKDACVPIAEWLLDNFYVVQEQIRDIREHMPPAFFRELPTPADGVTRVHRVARELVSHCDNALDEELVVRFVDQFQVNAELTIGETWAFPVMLRLVLIENLSAICSQLVQEYRSLRDVSEILAAWERDARFQFPDGSSLRCAPTVIALDELLRERGSEHADARVSLDRHLQGLGWNLIELRKFEQHRLAANRVSMGNIITSMRLLGSLDWVSFFERTNRSERILRRDPVQMYEQMDFPSRNRYRDVIEELSKCSRATETEIAEHALRLAHIVYAQEISSSFSTVKTESEELNEVASHIGFWLVDDGRRQIEKLIHYRPTLKTRAHRWIIRHPYLTYFGGLTLPGCALFYLLAHAIIGSVFTLSTFMLLLLSILPLSEIVLQALNSVLTHAVKVHLLPKLEFRNGVHQDFPTFIVVPSMLTSRHEAASLLAKLENHFLANSEPAFLFALLTDFADAPQERLEDDATVLQVAIDGIRRLNQRYATEGSSPFYLFHRERRWNAAENKWMGWERKRGKLMEFGQLLAGSEETSYTVKIGDLSRLAEFRKPTNTPFVITLDSDTILPRGAARKLVGTLAHPLNRPVTHVEDGGYCVTRGYSILQPRVSIHLGDNQKTRYLRVHATNPGVDPYASAASDVYQDLFGEGSFTGKGIYDLRAFERTLENAFPENRILSHDLIEGCHARVALVSDIEVFDGFPARYDTDARRQHRWVRGDWQISSWLFRRVPTAAGLLRNRLSVLSRWKILDNLRRSLVAPALITFMITGWIFAPHQAGVWSALAAVAVAFPVFLQVVTGIMNWSRRVEFSRQFRVFQTTLGNIAEQCFYSAVFLPYKALLMTDAVLRTLVRLTITRQQLLEWETAAATESRLGGRKWALLKHLSVCTLLAIAVFMVIDQTAWPAAAPWLCVWCIAPVVGHLISLPRKYRVTPMQQADREWLGEVASGTWAYFERFVNPEGNWLPPDNVQDFPGEKVASRISPTNEGLFLVSGLIARRFGFIGIESLVELWEKNLSSWNSLEQLHGHHFNWYETSELKALHPWYVSTVDSGNLMACYFTLCDGIADAGQQPLLGVNQLRGARASLSWLGTCIARETAQIDDDADDASLHREQLQALKLLLTELSDSMTLDKSSFAACSRFVESLQFAAARLNAWGTLRSQTTRRNFWNADRTILQSQVQIVVERFYGIHRDMAQFMPWLQQAAALETDQAGHAIPDHLRHVLVPHISLRELAQLWTVLKSSARPELETPDAADAAVPGEFVTAHSAGSAFSDSGEFMELIRRGSRAAAMLLDRLSAIREQCESAAFRMDFRFLYNARRKLFSIGYNVDVGKLDRSHYDLLCSECRVASYLAIAKGDVETEHWFRLGRQATLLDGQYTLLSWGGTMFEFLMPQLFQRSYEGSLIDTSCRTAVVQQTNYGRARHLPWGISESAYAAMASNSDYQYKSFGVPGLGLKRGLSKDTVVSPYSSALALPFAPKSATSNLKRLAQIALGRWGFYDAIDYTPGRQRRGQSENVVRNYMAHHQGMTLLAIANATQDQIVTRWFHAHPLVRANELLLQEKVPALVDSEVPNQDEVQPTNAAREETTLVSRRITGIHAGTPRVLLLSNGNYSALMTHTGGSYARHNELQVTRWRPDATRDCWGSFIYLRDKNSGMVWSTTYQPTRVEPDHYEVLFSVDKGEVLRRQGEIETLMEFVVAPDHNAEVRQLRITNHGKTTRRIEVTSYVEVVLASQAADLAHPAFQKLFVETEYIEEDATLIARRRPRDSQQSPVFALHTLALPSGYSGAVEYESSRENFLGRCRTAEAPMALESRVLSGTTGPVLDAIFSLRCVVTIAPAESVTLGITTAVAETHEQALAIADLFHDLRGVQRAFELAWAFTQIEMRHLNISAKDVHLFQQLGGYLLYPEEGLRAESTRIAGNRLGQNALWRFGISGDFPILLLRVSDTAEVEFARTIIAAHSFLMSRGLKIDLVISNDFPGAYFDSLQELLQSIVNDGSQGDAVSKRVFLLRGAQLTPEDHQLLDAAAAVLLKGRRGSLAQQLELATIRNRTTTVPGIPRIAGMTGTTAETKNTLRESLAHSADRRSNSDPEFSNGSGAFTEHGHCYEMWLDGQHQTPAPWSNVIANPDFGCLLTESGGGYTWYANSRENKLTVWSNDPTSDPPSEIVYLKDIECDAYWSPVTSLNSDVERRVVHGQGFTVYHADYGDVQSETFITVHAAAPLKLIRLRLHNSSESVRRLQVTYYAETVLGVAREETAMHQVSGFDAERLAILMSNGYHSDFRSQSVFLAMLNVDNLSWTGDRRSFIGRDGSLNNPAAMQRGLNQRVGAALDPCLALQGTTTIAPGDTEEVIILLGAGKSPSEAMELLAQMQRSDAAAEAIRQANEQWNLHLSALTVETPNRALDVMLNRWLPYQVLSCRVWGRSAFYQSGGAFGFRDQLQDVMALVYARPDLTRTQILKSAARQYPEGDVQHWWHPPGGKGTRTRFSDDFLFLPFVVLHYIQCTGDRSILEVDVPFIESPRLKEHEHERYEQPDISEQNATLLEHCLRAMQQGMQYGKHGLPLMGCGDWNDGMNKIGEGGSGESVWVAWFQISIFERFATLLRQLNDDQNAERFDTQARSLRDAVEKSAWDGAWYCRAFFDDGSPLGSRTNDECRIDSLTQSWAVIAGGPESRSREALASAVKQLVPADADLILLFTPPFDHTAMDPGYVKGYLPGVRENGGQYSHAAMWMVQAAAMSGDGALAMKLFDRLNPIHHADTPEKSQCYKVEPYVIAADVYANSQHSGRGGWTWYTGAAGWMYRVAIENILGIHIEKDQLTLRPAVPADWNEFRFSYRRNSTTWQVRAIRDAARSTGSGTLRLIEDGLQHDVELRFG
ncbi:MAG: hypothetical protein KDB01_05700 [Planctomycetaceae bacterium]|nr:hypothetical protein [Planctomycetaceae bacterium]